MCAEDMILSDTFLSINKHFIFIQGSVRAVEERVQCQVLIVAVKKINAA